MFPLQTCPTILVANKTDLVRNRQVGHFHLSSSPCRPWWQVKGSVGKEVATNYEIKYIETSPGGWQCCNVATEIGKCARESFSGINHNVDELLVGLVTQIHLRRETKPKVSFFRYLSYYQHRFFLSLLIKETMSKVSFLIKI